MAAPPDSRDAAARAVAAAPPPAAAAWTDAQTAALIEAMKSTPKGTTAAEKTARWVAIAAKVEGREPAECVARFQQLAAASRAAAAAAPAV